jgi:hypothetical protein
MKVINTTAVPTERIKEILAVVTPPGVAGYQLRITKTNRGTRGYAWFSQNKIVIRYAAERANLGRRGPRPPCRPKRGYLPTPWFGSNEEYLVYIIAHELRHLWQARVPRGRRVWGARGQFSERDADAYAIRMLRAWRRQANRGV